MPPSFCGFNAADISLVIVASFFGRIKGGNMIYRLCVFWADLWFAFTFIRVKSIYETPYNAGEKALL
ncbi:hypothetical protein LWM68_35450 [Niabella sp. W65]|nr:hypothetical protein [Niabella sp. W65]MCH7367591.1 hypothetical protein [Niabella sp. W65]